MADFRTLNKLLGNIDLYLLDQVLKGRFEFKDKILDAGCGEGRNLIYFMQQGYDVYGIDREESAIRMLRYVAKSINKDQDTLKFASGMVEDMPYEDGFFGAVISNAVLHFAEDEDHFFQMMNEVTRVLGNEGILFIRMASDIGFEGKFEKVDQYKFHLPDGSVRFLLNKEYISEIQKKYSLKLLEPIKTVNVDGKRLMTTLVLKKD